MFDHDFIKRKIALIEEDLNRLSEFKDFTLEQIAKDYMKQAVVERLLERIITRAIDVNQHVIVEKGSDISFPRKYRETFLCLADLGVYPKEFAEKIAPSAGLRNALVHDYNNIDKDILHKSIGEAMKEFNEYGKYIFAFCERIPKSAGM